MRLSPDEMIFWQHGWFKLNGTIVFTLCIMLLLGVGARLITRRLTTEHRRSRWQNLLEIIVTAMLRQIRDVGLQAAGEVHQLSGHSLPFCGHGGLVYRHALL